MKLTRLTITYIASFLTLLSCNHEKPFEKDDLTKPSIVQVLSSDINGANKKSFASSLSKAISESPELRKFLKVEALKMMDEDFDIPYFLVKDQILPSGQTFEQILSSHYQDASELERIVNELPLLTIFIPTLPNNSFSAQNWDTENEVPFIAIRLNSTNYIPVISPEGEEYLLEPDLIPSYPVLVVKENERLIASNQAGFDETKSSRILKTVNGVSIKFIDDIFDAQINSGNSLRTIPSTEIDSKLVTAYNTYKTADGWQRDYIYYGITPTSPNGKFSYDFRETIRSFRITGDAYLVYLKLAEQAGDPMIKSGKKSSGWTDGYYEIRANTLIQAQNGVGSTLPGSFICSGAELFNVTYDVEKKGVWPFRYNYYTISSVSANVQDINVPIIRWDLNNYAATLRIDVEEVDNTTLITESTSSTVKFATNFGFEAEASIELVKLGRKFGASLERTVTNSVQRQYTLNSDQLGTVLVNFADKVILSYGTSGYSTQEYGNDIFSISVEPVRVQ